MSIPRSIRTLPALIIWLRLLGPLLLTRRRPRGRVDSCGVRRDPVEAAILDELAAATRSSLRPPPRRPR